jgi:hypothetical protein
MLRLLFQKRFAYFQKMQLYHRHYVGDGDGVVGAVQAECSCDP